MEVVRPLLPRPLKICLKESNDRTRRACKVIILGLKESDSSSQKEVKQHDLRLIDQILKEAEVDLQLNETQFFRLGK